MLTHNTSRTPTRTHTPIKSGHTHTHRFDLNSTLSTLFSECVHSFLVHSRVLKLQLVFLFSISVYFNQHLFLSFLYMLQHSATCTAALGTVTLTLLRVELFNSCKLLCAFVSHIHMYVYTQKHKTANMLFYKQGLSCLYTPANTLFTVNTLVCRSLAYQSRALQPFS